MGLFDRMRLFSMRLEKYVAVRPTVAMIDVVMKLMVEIISILGIATEEIGRGGLRMHFFVDNAEI